jgi:hypothetical protein
MDDKWDKDLKNRIRDVFDNYEDEHADEGWLLLREKYPEKAKRRAVAWLWRGSAAALLLLFVGIWWMSNKPVIKPNLASNKKQPANYQAQKPTETEKESSAARKESGAASNAKADSVINSQQDQYLATNTSHSDHSLKHAQAKTNPQSSLSTLANQSNVKKDDQTFVANNYVPKNDHKTNEIAATNQPKPLNQDVAADKTDNADKVANNIKPDNSIKPAVKSSTIAATQTGINMQEEVKKANKLPFSDDNVVDNKKSEKSKNTNKAVDFGVYAATYFNYAKGSSSQLNVGAGVTSDIKLSRNLDLSTGITIAQNTLSYGSQLPSDNNTRADAVATAPAATSVVTANYLAASGQNVYSAVTPSLKNYNASLIGLDVPVNLKYEFNPEKSPTYVSIGLSSGTFINETYTSTYNYSLPFVSNVSQTDQSVHQSFNSFYFAKTLNFSFGTGYSLGGNQLIIEPFLKYPLDGLGTEQIKFGAGGVNLKFNFQPKKK